MYHSRCPLETELQKKLKFNASGCISCIPEFACSGQILLVKGRLIDTIEGLASDMFFVGERHGATAELLAKYLLFLALQEYVEKRLLNERPDLQQHERAQLVVVRTLTADGTRIARTSTISQFVDSHALALAEMLQPSAPPSERAIDAFRFSPLLYVCSGRVIATLQNRYIYIAPQITQKGDVISVLQGSSLPWVSRPQGRDGQYKIVGACYVDGIMYNEEGNTAETLSDTFQLS